MARGFENIMVNFRNLDVKILLANFACKRFLFLFKLYAYFFLFIECFWAYIWVHNCAFLSTYFDWVLSAFPVCVLQIIFKTHTILITGNLNLQSTKDYVMSMCVYFVDEPCKNSLSYYKMSMQITTHQFTSGPIASSKYLTKGPGRPPKAWQHKLESSTMTNG